jgi:hypothetical protein
MSRFTFLILLFLSPAWAAELSSARPENKQLYDSGRFSDAAKAFAEQVKVSPRDAAVLYNLGNAYFKSGRTGLAIASFERAFALDPRDADTRFNLAFALRRAGEEFVPTGIPPAAFWIFTALSERELAGLDWIVAWTFLLMSATWLVSKPSREKLTPLIATTLGLWLVLSLWWMGLRSILPPVKAVITSPQAELRHGPGQNFPVAFTLPEGRRVRVMGASGTWLEVGVLKEGARGWIESSQLERL